MAYVYLIAEAAEDGSGTSDWTKIGFSQNDPNWRMNANLKRGNPREIAVMAVYEFSDSREARAAEWKAHDEFVEQSHKREWFRVNWEQIDERLRQMGYQPTTEAFKLGF